MSLFGCFKCITMRRKEGSSHKSTRVIPVILRPGPSGILKKGSAYSDENLSCKSWAQCNTCQDNDGGSYCGSTGVPLCRMSSVSSRRGSRRVSFAPAVYGPFQLLAQEQNLAKTESETVQGPSRGSDIQCSLPGSLHSFDDDIDMEILRASTNNEPDISANLEVRPSYRPSCPTPGTNNLMQVDEQ